LPWKQVELRSTTRHYEVIRWTVMEVNSYEKARVGYVSTAFETSLSNWLLKGAVSMPRKNGVLGKILRLVRRG